MRPRGLILRVQRVPRQWIIRDPEGNLWRLLSTDNASDERQPISSAENTELAPVPGLRKYTLGLPLRRKVSDL